MLEDIAEQYVSQSADYRQLARIGTLVVGAVIAAIVHRTSDTMKRAPYFALYALCFLVVSASQFAWLGAASASAAGTLWVLALSDLLVPFVAGYAVAVIAMARSRDAYGNARAAVSAFIPILFFWLFFAPSKSAPSPDRAPTLSLLNGWRGVLVGVMCVAGIVSSAAFWATQSPLGSTAQHETPIAKQTPSQELEAGYQLMTAAFECAALSDAARLPDEAKRLFWGGYRVGLGVMQQFAAEYKKQSAANPRPEVLDDLALVDTPNEFQLGIVFAGTLRVVEDERKKFWDANRDAVSSDALQERWRYAAENRFREKNCALLRFP